MNETPKERSRVLRDAADRRGPGFAVRRLAGVLAAALLPLPVTTNAPASDQLAAQIRSRLAEAQLDLGSLLAARTASANAPSGATWAETVGYQTMLQAMVRAYERQLADLAGCEAVKQRQRDIHLDVSRPLRVEVVPAAGDGAAQPDRPAAPAGPANGRPGRPDAARDDESGSRPGAGRSPNRTEEW